MCSLEDNQTLRKIPLPKMLVHLLHSLERNFTKFCNFDKKRIENIGL